MTTMTVNRLHKLLTKLIREGHGRIPVSVSKETFSDNREVDGCTILSVNGVVVQYVPQADDDGGTKVNKDGTESHRKTAVIYGYNFEPPREKP